METELSLSGTQSQETDQQESNKSAVAEAFPGTDTSSEHDMSWKKSFSISLQTQSYLEQQRRFWPREGKHILAQYDAESVVVYQAFRPEIAEYAVKHQQFGGDQYSFGRMSWIKTNFLWMMYRCGWAAKKDQQRVLAIWIPRPAFETILASAYTAWLQKSKGMSKEDISVRLQWDPDHTPTYTKCTRKAIQLGMKGEILQKFGTEWALKIEDVTKFVREQKHILDKKGEGHIVTPTERVYPIGDPKLAAQINLDALGPSEASVVVKGSRELGIQRTEQMPTTNVVQSSGSSSGDATGRMSEEKS